MQGVAGEPGTLRSTLGGLWFGLCPNPDSSPRCSCAASPSSSSSLAISSPPCGLCTRNSTVSGTGARRIEAGSSAHWPGRGFCTPCVVLGGGTPLSRRSFCCFWVLWALWAPKAMLEKIWTCVPACGKLGPVALIKEGRHEVARCVVSWWLCAASAWVLRTELVSLFEEHQANTENNFIPRARGYLKLFTFIENHMEGPSPCSAERRAPFAQPLEA